MTAPSNSSSPARALHPRRRRFTPLAIITGIISAIILALSMNSSLAAFTATILNNANTFTNGTLIMEEKNQAGTVTCLSTDGTGNNVSGNSATCSTINKYNGTTTLVPGQTVSTTVTIKNTGTVPANTFTLTPGVCTQSGTVTGSATDLCAKVTIVIAQTVGGNTTTVSPANSTLTSIGTTPATPITLTSPVAPGATVTFRFDLTLVAASGNPYQGLTASQNLTWTFTS